MGYPDVAWGINELRTTFYGGIKEFTDSGSFLIPDNVTKIYVTGCAGGGGGSKAKYETSEDEYYLGRGGGGGEAIFRKAFSVTPGTTLQITIGKGGAAGRIDDDGSDGGNTIISTLITLKGGEGGKISNMTWVPAKSGGNGGGYGGIGGYKGTGVGNGFYTTPINAENGIFGSAGFTIFVTMNYVDKDKTPHILANGGGGGGGSLGNGANGAYKDLDASPAGYGGGGGGGYYLGDRVGNASNGGDGIVIIEW